MGAAGAGQACAFLDSMQDSMYNDLNGLSLQPGLSPFLLIITSGYVKDGRLYAVLTANIQVSSAEMCEFKS